MLIQTYKRTESLKSVDNTTMPSIVDMIQYIREWIPNVTNKTRYGNLGTYQNYSYSITMDINDRNINSGREFFYQTLYKGTQRTTLSRSDIFEKFHVLEIPDYSSQAATNGLNDFTVEIYDNNGYKLLNSEIIILKSFTTKKAYILIDKYKYSSISGPVTVFVEPASLYSPTSPQLADKELKVSEYNEVTNEFIFTVNDFEGNNRTSEFITNFQDYGLYLKNNGEYKPLSGSTYSLKVVENTSQDINSMNYQTFNGSDIYERDVNNSIGDYLKQNQISTTQKIYPKIYHTPGDNENLRKMQISADNEINSINIKATLNTVSLDSIKFSKDNIILLSKQSLRKYIPTTMKTISILDLLIHDLNDFELYGYDSNNKGKILNTSDFNILNNAIHINISVNYDSYELKIVGDNKRTIDHIFTATAENKTIDIVSHLYNSKIFKYNINLSKAQIKCYDSNNLLQSHIIEDNKIVMEGAGDYRIVIRDYSNTNNQIDLEADILGTYSVNAVSYTDSTSRDIVVNEDDIIFDPMFTIPQTNEGLDDNNTDMLTNVPIYPYDLNSEYYNAIKEDGEVYEKQIVINTSDYNSKSVADLREIAKNAKLTNYSQLTKAKLIDFLLEHIDNTSETIDLGIVGDTSTKTIDEYFKEQLDVKISTIHDNTEARNNELNEIDENLDTYLSVLRRNLFLDYENISNSSNPIPDSATNNTISFSNPYFWRYIYLWSDGYRMDYIMYDVEGNILDREVGINGSNGEFIILPITLNNNVSKIEVIFRDYDGNVMDYTSVFKYIVIN